MNVRMKIKPDGSSVGGGFRWRTSPSTVTPLPTTYTQAYDNVDSLEFGINDGGFIARVAKKYTIGSAAQLTSTTFYLKKGGSPSGALIARVRKVSDSSVVATTSTSLDASALTTSYVEYTFSFGGAALPNEALYFTIETATDYNPEHVYASLTSDHTVFDEWYYKGTSWLAQITRGNAGSITVII